MALTIDQLFDLILSGIEAIIPRTAANIRFKRHRAGTDLAASPGAVRYFQIKIPTLLGANAIGPRSDRDNLWHGSDQFLIKIWYPADWVIKDDTTARGVDWVKVQDAIDITKSLCYGDILATLGNSYESPIFGGAYQEGNFYVLQFRAAWLESSI